jgi:hypothetical protein
MGRAVKRAIKGLRRNKNKVSYVTLEFDNDFFNPPPGNEVMVTSKVSGQKWWGVIVATTVDVENGQLYGWVRLRTDGVVPTGKLPTSGENFTVTVTPVTTDPVDAPAYDD